MSISQNTQELEGLHYFDLYKDQNSNKYIGVINPSGNLDLHNLTSKIAQSWVRREIYDAQKLVLSDDAVAQYLNQFSALCDLNGKTVKLEPRTAMTGNGEGIHIDSIDRQYVITKTGWREEKITEPLFFRSPSMLPLAKPILGGDIRKIFSFINIENDLDQILLLTHLVFSFVPEAPHPILILFGPQGSSKSFSMKCYSKIVDPNVAPDIHTYSEMEFQLAAMQKLVLILDNVSHINQRFSDTLCKIVTGIGFTRRILYTTSDMMTMQYMRIVLINGVNLPVEKSDLMDRSILISLDRIPNTIRKSETDLIAEFENVRGEILGGCFDILSKAMVIYPTINFPVNTRMTDYGRWGCAIALALGYTLEQFLAAIEKNTDRQNEESLDASPLVAVLQYCFAKQGMSRLIGTPTDLLHAIRNCSEYACIDQRMLPNTPRMLGKKLNEVKPNLEAEGYKIIFARGKERQWIIEPPESLKEEFLASKTPKASLDSLKTSVLAGVNLSMKH